MKEHEKKRNVKWHMISLFLLHSAAWNTIKPRGDREFTNQNFIFDSERNIPTYWKLITE